MKKHGLLLIALSFAGVASAQEVVRIGHAAAMTGPDAHFGKDSENGARMAIEALNARGAAIAGKKVQWQLIGEDRKIKENQAFLFVRKAPIGARLEAKNLAYPPSQQRGSF